MSLSVKTALKGSTFTIYIASFYTLHGITQCFQTKFMFCNKDDRPTALQNAQFMSLPIQIFRET